MTSSETAATRDADWGDSSVSPRDDLFAHINGGWLSRYELPDDRSGDGAMRELFDASEAAVRDLITALSDQDLPDGTIERKIADLFRSFMDTDTVNERGLTPVQADFAAIAQAPDKPALAQLMGDLERSGVPGVFATYVSADAKDSSIYALYFEQGGLHLPDESYYRDEEQAALREAFVSHVEAMSRLGGLSTHTGMSDEDLARAVLDFETTLASHHWDRVKTRDAEATYNELSTPEFAQLASGFDYEAWAGGAQLTAQRAVVREPSFFTGVGTVWADTDLSTLKAWLIFSTLDSAASLLSDALVEQHFDFYGRTLSGTPQMRERWKRGVAIVEGLLGEGVGRIYVEHHFPPEAKDAINDLVQRLTEAYDQSIRSLDWMGEETKSRALEKLSKFSAKVGYPDEWREYTAAISPDDLLGNMRRCAQAEHGRQLDRIENDVDPHEWFMTPQTVNAYYHPVLNEVVFPAAILQPPYFSPDARDATNFGAIGGVIGHEIGHGFDDQGSRYDGDGNLVDWWTPKDRERFEERTKALIDQYDALVPAGFSESEHVNGELTIGENIGDLGGLSIAWKALHIAADAEGRQVTDDDAAEFFFSWARAWRAKFRREERLRRLSIDPHSPEEFRCNQVVKNVDAFADTFGVRPGDAMYLEPEKRVSIW